MSAELEFKQLIDRILRCREAEDEAKQDTKEVYAELKSRGYDKTAAGALVAEIRKKDKNPDQFEERNAVLDTYREAYHRASHAHTREARISTGEITEPENQSEQPCTATDPSASLENASDTISSINSDASSHDATAAETGDCVSAADQFSRAPVETDPLREQADVKMAGTNPRETRPSASVALTNQQPGPQSNSPSSEAISSPLTKTAGDVASLASPATNSEKPNCLKLKNGHCRIGFETSALCATCNAERLKRRVA